MHERKVGGVNFTPGNYSAKFIEQVAATTGLSGPARHNMDALTDTIKCSIHFSLPDCGVLFPRKAGAEIETSDYELLKPPFDDVVIEYTAVNGFIQEGQSPSSRRIVVASRHSQFGFDALQIIPISFYDASKSWVLPILGYVFPLEVSPAALGPRPLALKIMPDRFDAFVERMGDVEKCLQAMWNDAADEISAYIDLVTALSLTNVEVSDYRQPRALRVARSKKKQSLFDYKVLSIRMGQGDKTVREALYGDRASPRSHLRRGHLRTLGDGRRTWVRPAFIHGSGDGFVHKSYKLA